MGSPTLPFCCMCQAWAVAPRCMGVQQAELASMRAAGMRGHPVPPTASRNLPACHTGQCECPSRCEQEVSPRRCEQNGAEVAAAVASWGRSCPPADASPGRLTQWHHFGAGQRLFAALLGSCFSAFPISYFVWLRLGCVELAGAPTLASVARQNGICFEGQGAGRQANRSSAAERGGSQLAWRQTQPPASSICASLCGGGTFCHLIKGIHHCRCFNKESRGGG